MKSRLLILLVAVLCASGCSQSAQYEQLFVGYNGPSSPKTEYFDNAASVRASWVARALSPAELERVLARVSFGRELLVAATVGERETVTQVSLSGISQYESRYLNTNVSIGVIEAGCSQPHARSFPFILAAVERPEKFNGSGGLDHQNYPDGCKPVMRGVVNERAL